MEKKTQNLTEKKECKGSLRVWKMVNGGGVEGSKEEDAWKKS